MFYAAILHRKCLLTAQWLLLKFRKLYKDSYDNAGLTFYDSIHFSSGYKEHPVFRHTFLTQSSNLTQHLVSPTKLLHVLTAPNILIALIAETLWE